MTLRAAALLLALLLLPGPALADLRADAQATSRKLLAWSVPADTDAAQAAVNVAVNWLHELAAWSEVLREDDPANAWLGWLLLAEGELGFGRGLLDAPCPDTLSAEHCATYRSHLADKAHTWLRKGLDAVRNAEATPTADGVRLGKLRTALLKQVARAEQLAPAGDDGPWVAVREDAWLFAPDGQKARVSGWEHPEERPPLRLRWLKEEGDRVFVQIPRRDPRKDWFHCLGAGPLGAAWSVTLQVDRADLVPVLGKEHRATYDDGTSVHLPVGVPLYDGHPRVHDGLLPITIDPLHRVTTWTSAGTLSPFTASGGQLPLDAQLRLDGRLITLDRDQSAIFPKSIDPQGDQTVVTMRSSCGEVVAHLDGPVPEPPPATGVGVLGGLLGGLGSSSARRSLPAGSALFWTDGTPAGQLLERRSFASEALVTAGERTCARVRMGYLHHPEGVPEDGAFTLCADGWVAE